MNLRLMIIASLMAVGTVFADDDNVVLFKFGNIEVTKQEFKYIYEKNNVGKATSYTDRSVREYLELYINFRMKVQEAKEEGLDTMASIQAELGNYRKQLAQSYLVDKEHSEYLVKEAYERLQKEIKCSHVIIAVGADAPPSDTIAAYRKIMKVRERLLLGEDFATVAREVSDDPSVKTNGGSLGYFTAMQMVYPFETVAYNTKKGQLSMPVRTQFGYHLIKIEDVRKAIGEMKASHIFVRIPPNSTPEKDAEIKQRIDEIYEKVLKGDDFATLAKELSEDQSTSSKGGDLGWFGVGRMVPEFEKAAFALSENGQISEPLKTKYGYHIIKRTDRRELPSLDDMHDELKRRVQRDPRAKVVRAKLLERIKKENNLKEYSKVRSKLYATLDSSFLKKAWTTDKASGVKGTLFSIGSRKIAVGKFAEYLFVNQHMAVAGDMKGSFDRLYTQYLDDMVLQFEEDQLESKYPEFKALMNEYRDGILLFELTDRKVWSRAVKDTSGLEAFFNVRNKGYMWNDRVSVKIYKCKTESIEKDVRKYLKKGKDIEWIKKSVNSLDANNLIVEEGVYEKGQNFITDQLLWKVGMSSTVRGESGYLCFANIIGLLDPMPKTLDEAKGYVVADYQEYLEEQWLKDLSARYPITVNEEILQSLITK